MVELITFIVGIALGLLIPYLPKWLNKQFGELDKLGNKKE